MRTSGLRSGSSRWRLAAAGTLSSALFLALTLPQVPSGPVIGTGQDEWYNVIRGLRALYEQVNPSYFIHSALYYELLALLYGVARLVLVFTGSLAAGSDLLGYFLTHQAQFLDLARYASVGCGVLAVLAAVQLGTVLSGTGAGLLAGLLIASLPLVQALSTAIRVDALALATWIAASALVVRRYRRPDRISLILAAAAIGVAAAANYPGALLLVLLGWFEAVRRGDDRFPQRARRVAAACAIASVVFIALNPYVLIDLPRFLTWFFFQARVALVTHPHGQEPSLTRYIGVFGNQGAPAVVACLAGTLAMASPRDAAGALAGFALLYVALFSVMLTQYERFVLPALALLCIAGAAWICGQLASRLGPRAATGFVVMAALLVLWSDAAPWHRGPPKSDNRGSDYRAEMFAWIAANLPPTATLVFESDTLPLVQEIYDSGTPGRPFHAALQQAFEQLHPGFPKRLIKAQFIGAMYNYDPKLLEDGQVFFLASSQNRSYIAANRDALAEPAAFYDAIDAGATVVHEAGGVHERLVLYAIRANGNSITR